VRSPSLVSRFEADGNARRFVIPTRTSRSAARSGRISSSGAPEFGRKPEHALRLVRFHQFVDHGLESRVLRPSRASSAVVRSSSIRVRVRRSIRNLPPVGPRGTPGTEARLVRGELRTSGRIAPGKLDTDAGHVSFRKGAVVKKLGAFVGGTVVSTVVWYLVEALGGSLLSPPSSSARSQSGFGIYYGVKSPSDTSIDPY